MCCVHDESVSLLYSRVHQHPETNHREEFAEYVSSSSFRLTRNEHEKVFTTLSIGLQIIDRLCPFATSVKFSHRENHVLYNQLAFSSAKMYKFYVYVYCSLHWYIKHDDVCFLFSFAIFSFLLLIWHFVFFCILWQTIPLYGSVSPNINMAMKDSQAQRLTLYAARVIKRTKNLNKAKKKHIDNMLKRSRATTK